MPLDPLDDEAERVAELLLPRFEVGPLDFTGGWPPPFFVTFASSTVQDFTKNRGEDCRPVVDPVVVR